jgi:hypothetical protein
VESGRPAARWMARALFALLIGGGPAAGAQRTADPAPAEEAPVAAPVVTPPVLLEAPELTLPEGAELPEDAAVGLIVTILPDGSVGEALVEEPLRPDVDALVEEAALAMRFEPARRDGEPIPVRIRFRYRISVTAPAEAEPEGAAEGADGGNDDEAAPADGSAADGGAAEDASAADPDAEDPEDAGSVTVDDLDFGATAFRARAVRDRPEPGAAARITLRAEELTTVPGTFGEPLRVVATLPGVTRSPFGLGFFLVRGANFGNTGFFVDGFEIPLLYHLAAGPAVISSRLVERLDFYPGGYPARFGRFSAGIVSVETGPPPTDRIRGELEIDLFRASALAVLPFDEGRGSVAIALRRSYYDLILPLVIDGLTVEYTDYQLRADYRINDQVRVSLFAFGSDDVLDQSGAFGSGTASANTSTFTNYQFQRVIGKIDIRLPGRSRLSIAGMVGRERQVFANASPGQPDLTFDLGQTYLGLRVDGEIRWADWTRTLVGFDINTVLFGVEASAFTPGGLGQYPAPLFTPQPSPVNRNVVRATGALYLDQVFNFGPVQWSIAGRFDYMRYGQVSDVYPDPRTVLRWRVAPELVFKAATGLFTQPPVAFQVVPEGGNPALRPERSWQSSTGFELTLPEAVELQATAYYSQMFQISRQVNRVVNTDEGPRRQFFADDGEGRAYGLEILLRRRIERGLYGWLSYTLSRSERRNGDGIWEPFAFDQTHTLNLAASYEVDGWRFGGALQLVTGRPTTTPVRARFDGDEGDFNPSFRDLGERLPAFHRLDLRIDRDFDLGPLRGSVYIDVQNVYNAPNNEGVLYRFDFDPDQTQRLPGIPILPTFGVRGIID